jgi:uncharacterized protein YdcH (DUF465 family)
MPMPDFEELKQELVQSDNNFRQLFREHQQFERRLEKLSQKSLLSPEDELEEKRIKVHKLHLKDQMESLLRAHVTEHAVATA